LQVRSIDAAVRTVYLLEQQEQQQQQQQILFGMTTRTAKTKQTTETSCFALEGELCCELD
jgi:hypothetical protein